MTSRFTPKSFVDSTRRAFRAVNYRYEFVAFPKWCHGTQYYSYDLASPPRERLRTALFDRIEEGDVVFDVGAYFGSYALPLANAGCTVHAFEPSPHNVDRLRSNFATNPSPDGELIIHEAGLGSGTETRRFYQSSNPGYSSFDRDHIERTGHDVVSIDEVGVRSIDGLVEEKSVPEPDHIKIDVEGLGQAVLEGASDTLGSSSPIVYFEPHAVEDGEFRGEQLGRFLGERGYDIHVDGRAWTCTPVD